MFDDRPKRKSFEATLHTFARAILPFAVIKYITPLYYGLNNYRFKLLSRPYIPQA